MMGEDTCMAGASFNGHHYRVVFAGNGDLYNLDYWFAEVLEICYIQRVLKVHCGRHSRCAPRAWRAGGAGWAGIGKLSSGQWARGAAWAGFGGLSSEQWVHGGAWAGSGGLNSGHCVADLVMLLDGVPQFGERHAQGERHS